MTSIRDQSVDILLYRESHLLPQIELNCETGLFLLSALSAHGASS